MVKIAMRGREPTESDRYEEEVLNAMYDSVTNHKKDARVVLDGESDVKGQNHYGEVKLVFERNNDTVEAWLYVNYITFKFSDKFFDTDESGVLTDNKLNRSVHEIVSESVKPLDMQDFIIKRDEEKGSNFVAFRIKSAS